MIDEQVPSEVVSSFSSFSFGGHVTLKRGLGGVFLLNARQIKAR